MRYCTRRILFQFFRNVPHHVFANFGKLNRLYRRAHGEHPQTPVAAPRGCPPVVAAPAPPHRPPHPSAAVAHRPRSSPSSPSCVYMAFRVEKGSTWSSRRRMARHPSPASPPHHHHHTVRRTRPPPSPGVSVGPVVPVVYHDNALSNPIDREFYRVETCHTPVAPHRRTRRRRRRPRRPLSKTRTF